LQIRCPAEISHVTVHARGAVITRTVTAASLAALSASPGPDAIAAEDHLELLIPDITPLADPSSLRAALLDQNGSERQVVSIRSMLVVPETPSSPGPAAADLEAHNNRLWRLSNESERLQRQRQRLLATAPDPALRTTSFVEKVDARMSDALATAGLLLERQQHIDRRVEDLTRQIEAVRLAKIAAEVAYAQATSRQRSGEEHPTRAAVIVLAGRGPLPGLRLTYVVNAARFWPLYTLRIHEASDDKRRGTWLLEALVAQRSGEDWSQARISVSTADLLLDTRLPELASLRFGRAQAATRRGYRPPPAGLDALFAGYDQTFAGQAPPVGANYAGGAVPPSAQTPVDEPQLDSFVLRDDDLEITEADEVMEEAVAPPPERAPAKRKRAAPPRDRQERESYSEDAMFAAPEVPSIPSPSMMAPPPAPGAAAPKGRAFGGLQRSGASGGAELRKKSMALDLGAVGGGGGGEGEGGAFDEDDAGPDSSAADTSEQWLDFDRLSLAGASDRSRRGRLVPSPDSEGHRQRSQAADQIEHLQLGAQFIDPLHNRGQFDHRYDSEGVVRVPSDGSPHRILLRCVDCAPGMRLLAVPREQAEVFREAELRNPLSAPLLAGPVDVYVEGSLLTTAQVAAIDRGGALRVGMGVEDRVRVARNIRSDEETTGLLGGSTQVNHHVSIELSSALGQAVVIDLYDRLPVSDDKSVSIDLLSARPEAKEYTQSERGLPIRGGLVWSVPLPAGGKAKVEYSYRIVFPAKSEIVGGNRRD
jgi:hypothetical protein